MSENTVLIFVSYKHSQKGHGREDEKYVEEFLRFAEHAIPNVGGKFLRDTDLRIGDKWDEKLRRWLKVTDIFLAFVSQEYLNSTYVTEVEVKEALESKLIIKFPVMVGTAMWEHTPWLTEFLAYPALSYPPINTVRLKSQRDIHYKNILLQLEKCVREKLVEVDRPSRHAPPLPSLSLLTQEHDNSTTVEGTNAPSSEQIGTQLSKVDSLLMKGMSTFAQHHKAQYREALTYAREALALVEQLPLSVPRTTREIQSLVGIGSALQVLDGWSSEEANEKLHRAFSMYSHLPKRVQNSPEWFPVLNGLWSSHFVMGDLNAANFLSLILENLSGRAKSPQVRVEAKIAKGSTELRLGQIKNASRILNLAFQEYRKMVGMYPPFTQDPGVASLTEGALASWLLGRIDEALGHARFSLALAKDFGQEFTLAFAQLFSAMVFMLVGDVAATKEMASIIRNYDDFAIPQALGKILMGWVEAQEGNLQRGTTIFSKEFDTWSDKTGARVGQTQLLAVLVSLHIEARQYREARNRLKQAWDAVANTNERWFEAELNRLEGELAVASVPRPNFVDAETYFRKAIEVSQAQGAKSLELRAVIGLGNLLQRVDREEELRAPLQEILSAFRHQKHETPDLAEAKRLQSGLS